MQSIYRKAKGLMAKCLISYMLIIILPTILLLNSTIKHTNALMKSELQNVQDLVAHDVVATLNTRLSSIEKLSESFHYASAMRNLIEEKNASKKEIIYNYFSGVDSFFDEILLRNRYVMSLNVYTENKRVNDLLYEFESMDSVQLPTRNGWSVETGESGISITYFCRLFDQYFMRGIGMIGLSCTQDIFLTALQEYGAESWCLTDESGLIYASESLDAKWQPQVSIYAAKHRTKGDHVELLADGTRVTIMRLDKLNMYLICLSQWDPPTIARLGQYSFFHWVIALCVLMNVAFFLFIARPLNTISRLSSHIATTELEPYAGKITQDEIGDLISSYNALVDRTQKMIDTVRQSEFLRLNAQISALKAQIDPHFFYGTLESIRMIAEADGQESISHIAYSFSQLMRYSLAERYYATVGEEIEVVKKYQDIQMWRLGMRINFSWDVDPHTLPVICPHFILHPLVENSIVHGASKTLHNTHIDIRIALQNQQVVIEVSDNGPGISQQRLEEIRKAVQNLENSSQMQSSENGRGILNVASRLQLYYGSSYSLDISSEPFCKTSVRIAFGVEPSTLLVRDKG